jgi:hypothetical protein
MIKQGIHINAIYQHYKNNYYRVINVAQDAEDLTPPIVVYYRCDKNGIFQSIREFINNQEKIVHQPFYTSINRFANDVVPVTRMDIKRDILPSELTDGVVPRFRFVREL